MTKKFSPNAIILLIEGKRAISQSFAPLLEQRGYIVRHASSVKAATEETGGDLPDLAILDSSSMRSSGTRMIRTLAENLKNVPIVVIVPEGQTLGVNSGASTVIEQPCTGRKLLNAIQRILPTAYGEWLQIGKIQFNAEQNKLRVNGTIQHLTPKKTSLLQTFVKHPREIVSRAELIKQVWETDYIGDTRTLDVHISWLRQALEEDPRNPELLETIRGNGYRLNVDVNPVAETE